MWGEGGRGAVGSTGPQQGKKKRFLLNLSYRYVYSALPLSSEAVLRKEQRLEGTETEHEANAAAPQPNPKHVPQQSEGTSLLGEQLRANLARHRGAQRPGEHFPAGILKRKLAME